MSANKRILVCLFVVSVVVFVFGLVFISRGQFDRVVWFLSPLGIFIWGDALIIGPFLTIASSYLYVKDQPVLTAIFITLYASVRAFVEVLYNLASQFTTTTRPWESDWQSIGIVHVFGVTNSEVLAQVGFTAITVAALFLCLVSIKRYLKEY